MVVKQPAPGAPFIVGRLNYSDLVGTPPTVGGSSYTLPAAATTALGGIFALATASGHQFVTFIDNGGVQHTTQPAFSDISGIISFAQLGAFYSNGQILIGNASTGNLTPATLTAGSNVSIVNGPGTITISATGGGGGGGIPSTGTLDSYAAHNSLMNGLAYDPRDPAYGAICHAPNTFVGNGSTKTFTYTIPFTGSSSTDTAGFYVYVQATSGGVTASMLVGGTDYTVTGVNSGVGGTITLVTAPTASQTLYVHHNDSAGILAAATAAAASGGYVSAPDNCWISNMSWVNGGNVVGQGFSPNYSFNTPYQRPVWNIISPAGHLPQFGINLGSPYITQAMFEGFDIKGLYFTTPVCLGTNAGAGGGVGPGIVVQYMNIEQCQVGFGAPIGGVSGYIFAALRFNNFSDNGHGVYGPLSDAKIIGNTYVSNYLDGLHLGPQQGAAGVSAGGMISNERYEYNGLAGINCDSCVAMTFENIQVDNNAQCGMNMSGNWKSITVQGGYFTGNANGGYPNYSGNQTAGQDAHICFNGTGDANSFHMTGVDMSTNYAVGHTALLGSNNATTPAYGVDFNTAGTSNENVELANGDAYPSVGNAGGFVKDFAIYRNGRPTKLKIDLSGQAVQGKIANGNAPSEARGLPSNQWSALNIYGDASSNNSQAIPTRAGWGGLLAKQMGAGPTYNITNDFGHFDCDIVDANIATATPPNDSNNALAAWLPTPQEVTFGGGFYQGHEADTNSCRLGGLTWLTVPAMNRVYAQGTGCVKTGGWTNSASYGGTYGMTSATNGDTMACTATTNGGPLYLWYQMAGNNGGTFTYNLDGGNNATVTTQGSNSFTFPIAGKTTLAAIRIPVKISGSHTVNMALTSTTSVGNTVTIEGLGTPPGKPYSSKAPVAIIGGELPNATFPAAATAFNTDIRTQVSQLAADGLQVLFADVQAYWNAATDTMPSGNINSVGQTHIAQAYAGALQPQRETQNTVNPLDYGASCNSYYFAASYCTTCNPVSTTAGSNQVSVANYVFQPGMATQHGGGDVGKRFCVGPGGGGGANGQDVGPCTYIAAVNTATNKATLGANMAASGAHYGVMGGYPTNPNDPSTAADDTLYIQKAANAAVVNGGKVFLPNNCMVHNLTMPRNVTLAGNSPGDFYIQTNEDLNLNPQATVLNCGLTGFPSDTQQCIQTVPSTRFKDFMIRCPTFPFVPFGINAAALGYSDNSQSGANSQILTENLSFFGCPIDIGQAYGWNYDVGFTGSIADNGNGTSTMNVTSIDTTKFLVADNWSAKDFLALGRIVTGPGVTAGTKITLVPPGGGVGNYLLDHALNVTSTALVAPQNGQNMEIRDRFSQHLIGGIGYNGDFTDSMVIGSVCTGDFINSCIHMGPRVNSGQGNGSFRWIGGRMEEAQGPAAVICDDCGIQFTGVDFQFQHFHDIIQRGGYYSGIQITGGAMGGGGSQSTADQDKSMIEITGSNAFIDVSGVTIYSSGSKYLFATATGVGTNNVISVEGGSTIVPSSAGGTVTNLYNWSNGAPASYKQDVSGWPKIDNSLSVTRGGALALVTTSIVGGAPYWTALAGTTTSVGTVTMSALKAVSGTYDCAGGSIGTTSQSFVLSATTSTSCALSLTTTVTAGDKVWGKAIQGNK